MSTRDVSLSGSFLQRVIPAQDLHLFQPEPPGLHRTYAPVQFQAFDLAPAGSLAARPVASYALNQMQASQQKQQGSAGCQCKRLPLIIALFASQFGQRSRRKLPDNRPRKGQIWDTELAGK